MENIDSLFKKIKDANEVYIDDVLLKNKWSSEDSNGTSVVDVLKNATFYIFTLENGILRIKTK